METLFDKQLADLFQQFKKQPNGIVLTPNLRLSRYLQERYTAWHSEKAFEPLPVYSLQLWLEKLYDDLSWQTTENFPLLLDSFQESWLWNLIIEESEDTPRLINQQATATQAQEAWRLIQEWLLNLDELEIAAEKDSEAQKDSRIFYSWCRQFIRKCQDNNLLSQTQVIHFLQNKLDDLLQRKSLVPSTIWRYGFDEISPSAELLFNQLIENGLLIQDINPTYKANTKQRTAFANETEEIRQIARWAKDCISQNSEQTLGIVFPDLTQKRQLIENLFREEFEPEYIQLEQAQHASSFNMSAGQTLGLIPAIKTAICILQSTADFLPLEQVSQLLLSPFIGDLNEFIFRAECDKQLRKLNEQTIGILQLKRLVSENQIKNKKQEQEQDQEQTQSHFYQCLSAFELIRQKTQKQQIYPSQWVEEFNTILRCWNWPGTRQLDSLEYQQLQTWQSQLEYFAGLDFLTGKLNYSAASHLLLSLLQKATFHAETFQSPVQILGVLEAAGLAFDQLWIAGLDAASWPASAQPNTLLPLKIQRQHNLPHSSAERELIYAQRMSQRWENSTTNLFISYVSQKDDQRNQISQLVNDYPEQELTALINKSYAENFYQDNNHLLEYFQDEKAPAIQHPEKIRGGTQLIKSQAACPFQAFAHHRLYAEEINSPENGLNAMERGNLIHESLEIIWRKLHKQETLLAMSDEQVLELIESAVTQALQTIRFKRVAGQTFIALEKQRLSEQIWKWMQIERKRKPFTVLLQESKKILQLGQLPVHMRYDRIDELADGSLLVLDYKTGSNKLADWQGERPNEPQVPLYAIANKDKVSAASFGIVNNQEIKLLGICENNDLMPELTQAENLKQSSFPESWEDILQYWENNLTQIADDFIQGNASVTPKQKNTCDYCSLPGLCRKYDQVNFSNVEDSDEELQELPYE